MCETPHGVSKQKMNNSNTNITGELLEAFVILSRLKVCQIESLYDEQFFQQHSILGKARKLYDNRITKAERRNLKMEDTALKIQIKDQKEIKSKSLEEKMAFITPYLEHIGFEIEGKKPKVSDLKKYVIESNSLEEKDPALKYLLKEDFATLICNDVAAYVNILAQSKEMNELKDKVLIPAMLELEMRS